MSLASQEASLKTEQEGNKSESDEEEIECRICHDTKENDELVSPCDCKGTVGLVHLACLQRWLLESARSRCELCGARFVLTRSLHRTARRSMLVWWCVPRGMTQPRLRLGGRHALRSDLLALAGVALLLSVANCACVMLADFYLIRYSSSQINLGKRQERMVYSHHSGKELALRMTRDGEDSLSTAMPREIQPGTYITQVSGFFTATMLMLLVLVSFSCFVCWAQLALRLQADIWFFWWQHDITITVVAEPVDKRAYRRSMHLSRRRENEGPQNADSQSRARDVPRMSGADVHTTRRGSEPASLTASQLFSPASIWARFRRNNSRRDSISRSPLVRTIPAEDATVAGAPTAQTPQQQQPPPIPSGAQNQAQASANAPGSSPVHTPAVGGASSPRLAPTQQQQPSHTSSRPQTTTNASSSASVRAPAASGGTAGHPAPAVRSATNASSSAPARAPAAPASAQQQPPPSGAQPQATARRPSLLPASATRNATSAGGSRAPTQGQQPRSSRSQAQPPADSPAPPRGGGSGPATPAIITWRHSTGS